MSLFDVLPTVVHDFWQCFKSYGYYAKLTFTETPTCTTVSKTPLRSLAPNSTIQKNCWVWELSCVFVYWTIAIVLVILVNKAFGHKCKSLQLSAVPRMAPTLHFNATKERSCADYGTTANTKHLQYKRGIINAGCRPRPKVLEKKNSVYACVPAVAH